jgi:hypothetical protein
MMQAWKYTACVVVPLRSLAPKVGLLPKVAS